MLLLASCCTIAALGGAVPPGPHGGWVALADGLRPAVEIDRRRLVRDRGFVDVWVRARGSRDAVAAEFEAAGVPAQDVARVRDAFAHSVHLWSFHCDGRTHALARSAYYATDGSLIRAFDVGERAYWPVQPDTIGQRLLATACGASADDTLAADEDTDERSEDEPAAARR